MTWSAPVVRHLWESETGTALLIPHAALFCRWSAPFLCCCYLISGSSNKSDSFTLMLPACSLGAGEHEEILHVNRGKSGSSLWRIQGTRNGTWKGVIAGVTLTSNPFPVLMVSRNSLGNVKVLFFLLLTLNYTTPTLYNTCLSISTVFLSQCASVYFVYLGVQRYNHVCFHVVFVTATRLTWIYPHIQ